VLVGAPARLAYNIAQGFDGPTLKKGVTAKSPMVQVANVGDTPLGFHAVASVSWLQASPAAGTLAPGQTANVTLAFASAGLSPGVFDTEVRILAAGAARPLVVPFRLTVSRDAELAPAPTAGRRPVRGSRP
jgi:hypothetical protein